MSDTSTPIVPLRSERKERACAFSWNPNWLTAMRTLSTLPGETFLWLLRAREAVPSETPAAAATSRIVGRAGLAPTAIATLLRAHSLPGNVSRECFTSPYICDARRSPVGPLGH